jgi:hypothetical protein
LDQYIGGRCDAPAKASRGGLDLLRFHVASRVESTAACIDRMQFRLWLTTSVN